jgi:hypothetical protein
VGQSLDLKISGLHLFESELSEVPPGALSVADNIVINRPSVGEPRRGFDRVTGAFSDSTNRANKVFFYKSQVLTHYDTNLLAYNSGSAWVNYTGTFSPPSATIKVRAAEANQNFYFTTSSGVYKLDDYTSKPIAAGAPKGLDLQASLVNSSNWLTDKYRVAYRLVFGYKDVNNNLILGAPSPRESIKNTSGSSRSVTVSASIPSQIVTAYNASVVTSWIYQLYRSEMIDNTSSYIEPSEEMRLVYEGTISSGEIAAGSISIADIVDDALRLGATIYTAASQEGLANGNEQPPQAKDVAVYKNVLFYGNTTSRQRYFLTLLSVGGTNGLQHGDTVTIGGVTYTAKFATETVASGFFATQTLITTGTTTNTSTSVTSVATVTGIAIGQTVTGTGIPAATTVAGISGTTVTLSAAATASGTVTLTFTTGLSAAQAIHDTAISLVRVINRYTSSTVYGFYLSQSADLPGKILLEERAIGGAAFVCVASRATCWSPALPTSGTTQSSTADTFKNAVYYSKTSQPESVPLGNYLFAGSANKDILRILPLRDSLFILKQDGIYRLSGEDAASFRVDLLDSTAILIAPESAVVLNNQIYALTTQGVVTITETGVQVVSRPIESTLLSLQGQDLTVLQNQTFAVSYESERKYILFVLSVTGDTTPTQAYVYNTFTNTWTRWPLSKTCGGVNPANDKLYLGDASTAYVNVERKAFKYTDYVDYGFTASISAVSGRVLTMTSTDLIAVGDIIYQSSSIFATVESVDSVAGTVTTNITASFTVASADVLKAITTKFAWVPFTMSNPGMSKHFREATIDFKSDFTGTGTLKFSSDRSPAQESETFSGTALGLWGLFPWGSVPWGGGNLKKPYRVIIPRNKQYCTQLTVQFEHSTGYAAYQLNGISLIGETISERVSR